MKARKLCILGASGRVGAKIIEILPEFPEFELGAGVIEEGSHLIGQTIPGSKLRFVSDLKAAVKSCECVLDFSAAEASKSLLQVLKLDPKPTLIGTTGLSKECESLIAEVSKKAALLHASNTSIGIFVLEEISKLAQKILGESFDIEIVETHRSGKVDAPSGTALTLANALAEPEEILSQRKSSRKRGELTIHSLRGGDVAGEHTVCFLGDSERVELTHRVSDRGVFARGALRLLSLLVGRSAGRYAPRDLFEGVYTLL